MPKLWKDSIEGHRGAMREAILAATGSLVAEGGFGAVTMVALAERAGVGRATLYRYMPDAATALADWHAALVMRHLAMLEEAVVSAQSPGAALRAVLAGYHANVQASARHDPAGQVHGSRHVALAQGRLRDFLAGIIARAAEAGQARKDVSAEALAGFAIAAIESGAGAEGGAGWLVETTLRALAPQV